MPSVKIRMANWMRVSLSIAVGSGFRAAVVA